MSACHWPGASALHDTTGIIPEIRLAEPNRFGARCPCGVRVRGQWDGQNRVRCPRCGRSLTAGALIETTALTPPPVQARGLANREKLDAFRDQVADVVSGRILWRAFRRWFTIPRIAGILGLVLLTGTVWWTWQSYRLRGAIATLTESLPPGEEALARGDFQQAMPLLKKAAQAGKIVGPSSLPGRRAIQLHREATVWWRLAPTSLDDFFAEQSESEQDFRQAFDAAFANRMLIFEGELTRVSRDVPGPQTEAKIDSAPKPTDCALDWVWLDDAGRRISVEIPSAGALDSLDLSAPQRVIFGAEVSGIESLSPGGTEWRLRLRPESVTLLTAVGPLVVNHWPDEPACRAILAAQAERLGVRE